MKKITESPSRFDKLESLSVRELLTGINQEDKTVAYAVEKCIPAIQRLVEAILPRMQNGGRLFYIGAGTSGRLGIVDASECPPTYGVDHNLVIGLIAGGDGAIRKAVEFAEDDENGGWNDLQKHSITPNDSVIGIAASGTTPYVVGALKQAREQGILTGAITCNPGSPVALAAEYPIEAITGPEFVTGSTRMKAGTAQKLILNMISTSLMIRLGRVEGNRMVDMQLTNQKLVERGIRMLMERLSCSREEAARLLNEYGNVRKAIQARKHP
ncbi:MAG: N-acetylmuramic acid 6-phosphate etherase [Flavobacteriales bacterium]|nr:N-acetylmuramic acid 6-phosphate etherase [Flavobacteriales bacterium]MCB9447689.1 N-acetylmuramic acid 6-phosphate etherase [Flavobacteriales bacterium]